MKVPDLSEAEKLDKFLLGLLLPAVFERVVLLAPKMFTEAATLAARTSTSLAYVADHTSAFGKQSSSMAAPTNPDFVPMVLGNATGGSSRGSSGFGHGNSGRSGAHVCRYGPGMSNGKFPFPFSRMASNFSLPGISRDSGISRLKGIMGIPLPRKNPVF